MIGTEYWLHKDIPDCEVFPASLGCNTAIRKDRPGDTKGGGVFILVNQRLVVSEQSQLSTNCEIVWTKEQAVGTKSFLIAAYYRPSEHDQVSAEELKNSLTRVDPSKQHVWVLGDFNYPKLDLGENQPIIKQNCRERSGSVGEYLTRDRGVADSSFTGVTALWSLSKTHLSSSLVLVQPRKTRP